MTHHMRQRVFDITVVAFHSSAPDHFPGVADHHVDLAQNGDMALGLAAFSLLFTVFSFWWLQARTGRLIGYAPATFTSHISNKSISVRIPVVTYNSGARGRIVRELRLVLS